MSARYRNVLPTCEEAVVRRPAVSPRPRRLLLRGLAVGVVGILSLGVTANVPASAAAGWIKAPEAVNTCEPRFCDGILANAVGMYFSQAQGWNLPPGCNEEYKVLASNRRVARVDLQGSTCNLEGDLTMFFWTQKRIGDPGMFWEFAGQSGRNEMANRRYCSFKSVYPSDAVMTKIVPLIRATGICR